VVDAFVDALNLGELGSQQRTLLRTAAMELNDVGVPSGGVVDFEIETEEEKII
jgi:hypothetical protein